MHLSRFPRTRFAHLNTPLEPMERLSRHLGGPRLWIKRDDCTGLSTGGNKTRKLEYIVPDVIASGADTLVDVIREMLLATTSERQGRMIDHDQSGSMERKKQEGYF